jgi:hypothetical protein
LLVQAAAFEIAANLSLKPSGVVGGYLVVEVEVEQFDEL